MVDEHWLQLSHQLHWPLMRAGLIFEALEPGIFSSSELSIVFASLVSVEKQAVIPGISMYLNSQP